MMEAYYAPTSLQVEHAEKQLLKIINKDHQQEVHGGGKDGAIDNHQMKHLPKKYQISSHYIEFMTLLNLLETYILLVLTIYNTSFELNNILEYFNAMIRIWSMFMCF